MEITNDPVVAAEARARALEVAALILQEEFGRLVCGAEIDALRSAAVKVRAKHAGEGSVTKPAGSPREGLTRHLARWRLGREGS